MTRAMSRRVGAAVAAAFVLAGLSGCGGPSATAGVTLAGGDGGGLPRSDAAAERIDASALQAARRAAEAAGARVFLAARHGHVVLEHYASGTDAADLLDGGEMAQTLAALAAGAAVADGKLAADTGRFDAAALAASIATATGMSYPDYLSQRVWQPLNAAAARLLGGAGSVRADCCVAARAGDWLRVGILLAQDGSFEGNTIVPAGWVARMRQPAADGAGQAFGTWLPVSGRDPELAGSESFAARDVYFLHGADGSRLWVAPALQLAVLYLAKPGAAVSDHTALFNQVIRAVQDRAQESHDQSLLQQLVPGH